MQGWNEVITILSKAKKHYLTNIAQAFIAIFFKSEFKAKGFQPEWENFFLGGGAYCQP